MNYRKRHVVKHIARYKLQDEILKVQHAFNSMWEMLDYDPDMYELEEIAKVQCDNLWNMRELLAKKFIRDDVWLEREQFIDKAGNWIE